MPSFALASQQINCRARARGLKGTILHLQEFVEKFPRLSVPVTIDTDQGLALEAKAAEVPGFVAPTLAPADWPEQARVVLVEAAGAVGKSAAARAIASRLNWPLVRVEEARVGSYSLSGLLQDGLGYNNTYISQVAEGSAGVVVDSLDEGHFRVGTENFLAFLQNVWSVAGSKSEEPVSAPSVILMSRSDTAELVKLAFHDADIPLAVVHLEFFDLEGSFRFIEAYMSQRFAETKRHEYNIALGSPRPFAKLRTRRFEQIARVLLRREVVNLRADWESLKDFSGYAPVLVAMAESLAVSNPAAERDALAADDQSVLLREIIEHISRREQKKFSEQIREKLQAALPTHVDGDVEATTLYGLEEQCARLLVHVAGGDIATPLPVQLPDAVRSVYEEAVRSFLPDHPFVKGGAFASVVFEDFVLASACRSLEIQAALPASPARLIEQVGPFFARFLADGYSVDEVPIDESLIELVIDSWTQETNLLRADDSEVIVSVWEGEGSVRCRRDVRSDTGQLSGLDFVLLGVSGALQFEKPVRRTTIATDQGVILGRTRQQLLIGPRVIVLAGELIIECDVLRVDDDRGAAEGVALASEALSANYLTKVEAGSENLHVYSEDPPARLRPFRRELNTGQRVVPYQRYVDLRTILTSFRPSMKGSQSVLAAKLEGKIVKENEGRLKLLAHLIGIGAVSRTGSWYILDLTVLGQQGFGLEDLKAGEPSRAVLALLVNCYQD